MTYRLPRGIWFEASKTRYRVRLYKNGVSYLRGYFASLEDARVALNNLREELERVPTLPRRPRAGTRSAPVPVGTLAGIGAALANRHQYDPNLLRRRRG